MNTSLKKKIILNDLYMLTAPVRHVPVLAVSQARANDSVSSRQSKVSLPHLLACSGGKGPSLPPSGFGAKLVTFDQIKISSSA